MSLKEEMLRCFFINKQDSPYYESQTFQQILLFVQTMTNKARLKQSGKMFSMIVEKVKTMEELHRFLESIHRFVFKK
jgi:transcription-repair coupling factor (superfamily II helicase)